MASASYAHVGRMSSTNFTTAFFSAYNYCFQPAIKDLGKRDLLGCGFCFDHEKIQGGA
jgi:hypothetical protein